MSFKLTNAHEAYLKYVSYITSCKEFWPLVKTIKLIIRYNKAYPEHKENSDSLYKLRYKLLKDLDTDYEELEAPSRS